MCVPIEKISKYSEKSEQLYERNRSGKACRLHLASWTIVYVLCEQLKDYNSERKQLGDRHTKSILFFW